jgi:NitT/TauT family transport system ATP-binding protein
MLSAENVTKTFSRDSRETVALDRVNLQFETGQFTCILGPSGSGKSTLLHILGGFEPATQGHVLLDNVTIEKPSRRLGMVFQQASLFPWLTVEKNVAWPLEVHGTPKKAARTKARELLNLVGLTGFESAFPGELSGGMKQRAAIARTLAFEPDVLLMDEPFGALDAQTRELMQEELSRIWQEAKLTVVFVTHDIGEAVFLADRVVLLSARPGRVACDIAVDLRRPRTPDLKKSTRMREYEDQFWDLLRHETEAAAAAAAKGL